MTSFILASRDRIILGPAAAILLFLSLLGIHGSSVGALEQRFGDVEQGELLAGTPRPIRSDEWQNTSPMIIAQVEAGLPRYNANMINDQGTSVAADLPEWGWHLAFEPQSWPFTVLPTNVAFAMHWWILMFLPFYGATRFAMRTSGSLPVAVAAGFAVTFGSLLQWWFLATTAIPVAAAFLCAGFVWDLIRAPTSESLRWSKMLGLGYWSTVLAVTIYPPYQIMSFWAIVFLAIGLLLARDRSTLNRTTALELGVPAAVAAGFTVAYALQNADIFAAFAGAEYPAVRKFESGAFASREGFARAFSGFLDYKLRIGGKAAALGTNESEASGTITLVPLFALTAGQMLRQRAKAFTALEASFLGVFAYQILVLLWMFSPSGLTPLFRIFFFDQVPPRRIIMGLFVTTAMLLILAYAWWREQPRSLALSSIGGLLIAAWVLGIGWAIMSTIDGYTTARPILLFAVVLGLGTYLLLGGWGKVGFCCFAAAMTFTGLGVHPLYSGLGYLDRESPVLSAIDRIDAAESGRWLADDFWIVNLPVAAGVEVLSGTQYYGDLDYWETLAVNEPAESLDTTVLRSAHVLARIDQSHPGIDVEVLFANQIGLQLNPCATEVTDLGTLYLLSTVGDHGRCTELLETVGTSTPLFIHKIGSG